VVKIQVDIIGGSIGGLSAAFSLKNHDKSINVIVHEKHKKIGYNHEGRRCGEAYAIEYEWRKWQPIGKSIFNTITRGESVVGNKKSVVTREPGTAFILNRPEFICQLAKKAEEIGVDIRTNDKIKKIADLKGDYIIDASGCPSSVKRELGFTKGEKASTYQQTLEKSNCFISDTIKIFYIGPVGYYWIFPRNPEKKEINLGVGMFRKTNHNLKEMLETFKEERQISGKINYVTGGLVSVGLQKPLMYKNILFIGDAGVGAFPFTAQGIYRALISGDVAGRCIANNCAKNYPHIMHQKFIKWELMGKSFLHTSIVLREINPKLVLTLLNNFQSFCKLAHL
jgi:flavin-dependent dehydrogenase